MTEPTSRWSLPLKAMIGVEVRTLLRGRNQIISLLLPMVILAVAIVGAGVKSQDKRSLLGELRRSSAVAYMVAGSPGSAPATQEQDWPDALVAIVRWLAIGAGGVMATFMSISYGTQAILAAFAGERDARTLEVLLASPIPNTRLFLLRCASVLLPTAAIGYIYLIVTAALAAVFLRGLLEPVPVHVLAWALLGGLPIMLLVNLFFIGLGAAVSIKSENMKGAAHLLGGVVFLVFFAIPYSIPLITMYAPAREAMRATGRFWIHQPFAAQYALVLAVLAIPAVIFLAIARGLFHRDRLLT